ncbi:uncharacterized protein LOC142336598 [Convolutriloba macropyga]|uniref:uncharacterized protein LOC142336598 n=1 Tax=Convolutriloba macropyga TaxID=536237 RepID=UPI003F525C70
MVRYCRASVSTIMGQQIADSEIESLLSCSEEDFPKFLSLLSAVIGDPCPSEDQLRRAFKVFDSRNKGYVSFEEMEYAVNKFMSSANEEMERSNNQQNNPNATIRSHGYSGSGAASIVSVQELEDMFSVTNRNKAKAAMNELNGVAANTAIQDHETNKQSAKNTTECSNFDQRGSTIDDRKNEDHLKTITVEDFIDVMKLIF